MKRSERHRLKENPVARFVADARAVLADYGRSLVIAALVVVGAAGAAGGYWAWRTHREAQADALLVAAHTLAEAPVIPGASAPAEPPPQGPTYPSEKARLEAALPAYFRVVERYPGTRAATAALYHAAGALAALGRLDEAAARYQEVLKRDPKGVYGQVAELGLADVHLAAGRVDQAIAIYRRLATGETALPVDGILIQLARAYRKAGQTAEATRTYTRLLEEFPQSMYAGEAREALETLRTS